MIHSSVRDQHVLRFRPGIISLGISFLLLCAVESNGQDVKYSIANEFRYGIGKQYQNEEEEKKEYLEDLFNTRLFLGDFRLGFRVQVDKPREFGPDTIGLTQYFAEFTRDGVTARGGTFYSLIGHGLVFNTFESRPVGFNTVTEGVKIDYNRKEFGAGVYGGDMGYADILNPSRVEEYRLRGIWGEGRPIDEISLGASYLAATGEKTRVGFRNEFDAYLREGWATAHYEGFTASYNWADKRTSLDSTIKEFSTSSRYGTGWYARLGYTGDLFSLNTEFKDYRFDLLDPNQRDDGARETRALPFQNAPTLVPEHDKTLLARNPHTIDFSDELGMQISSFVYPSENLTLYLLGTVASRHAAYDAVDAVDTNGIEYLDYQLTDAGRASFPKLSDDRYSPYWEIFAQGDVQATDDLAMSAALQLKNNVIFLDRLTVDITEPTIERAETVTGMVEGTYSVTSRHALHAILEVQKVYDSQKEAVANDSLGLPAFDGRFMNALLTLEFSRSPLWSANVRLEWTSSDREQGGRRIWPVVGGTYRIGRSHTLGLQYGYERGGIVCTGGVCRFINPFTGLRLNLVSVL